MDHLINQLKQKHKSNSKLKFNSSDREQVIQKIQNQSPKKSHKYPVLLTSAAIMFISFLLVMSLVNQSNSSSSQSPADIEGYVIKNDESQVMVTNYETKKSIVYPDFPEEIHVGQKVKIWNSKELEKSTTNELIGGTETYIEAEIEDYNIVKSQPVNGSILTEEEALRLALSPSNNVKVQAILNSFHNVYVKSIDYRKDHQSWMVTLSNEDSTYTIEQKVFDTTLSKEFTNLMPDLQYTFNYQEYGDPFYELEEDLKQKISEDGNILNQLAKHTVNRLNKNIDKGELINGVAINSGTVIIDFQPFQDSLTTAEMKKFSQAIKELASNYSQVKEIYFQFNGNRQSFYRWLGATVAPLTITQSPSISDEEVQVMMEEYKSFQYNVEPSNDSIQLSQYIAQKTKPYFTEDEHNEKINIRKFSIAPELANLTGKEISLKDVTISRQKVTENGAVFYDYVTTIVLKGDQSTKKIEVNGEITVERILGKLSITREWENTRDLEQMIFDLKEKAN